ncbi:MAG: hypothetical protein M1827_005150 [Pycnora praestabilis]|nr:MAG: hypothetical protein M1827_005150 [Pycnora praestabilis]
MPGHSRKSSLPSPPRSPALPSNAIESAVASAQSKYTIRNPQSLRSYNESLYYMPGGNTRTVLHTSPFPLTFSSGHGCKLTSLDGHTYTDFLGEYTAGIYGHDNPVIKKGIEEALSKGWNYGGNNLYEKELAKTVCERFSDGIEMVRFTNSGTEANMMALGAAVNFTGRKNVRSHMMAWWTAFYYITLFTSTAVNVMRRYLSPRQILVFTNGYHGSTLSFPSHHNPSTATMNLPHDFKFAPYNNIPKTRALLFGLAPNSLAAILVEPVQGSGGAIPGSPTFLRYLRDAATEYGALLILDEVMTSRLAYGGLGAKMGIKPDLMTLGKWVGGGMSFGAFGGRRDIMSMFDPRMGGLSHSGTFNNNVISMAAGIVGCKLLDEKKLDELNALGDKLKSMAEEVLIRHGILQEKKDEEEKAAKPQANGINELRISNGGGGGGGSAAHSPSTSMTSLASVNEKNQSRMYFTGTGSMLNVHFSGDDQDALRGLFFHHMLEENIYLAQRGFIALSIEIKMEHVQAFVRALERFVVRYQNVFME